MTLTLLVGAVAAGVGFQIPNSANLLGYHAELLAQGVSEGFGDVRVRPKKEARFEDGDAIARTIASVPSVRAALPALTMPGAVGKDGHFFTAPITGIDCAASHRPFRLLDGALLQRGDREGLLIGSALAKRLGVRTGDVVQLRVILSVGAAQLGEDDLARYSMVVRGIASGSFGAYETVFVDRAFLAGETGEPRAASAILVYSDDHEGARTLGSAIGKLVPTVDARAWMDDSPYLSSSLAANLAIGTVSRVMAVVAVTIPVWALLFVNVLSRRREIGILSAIGLRRGEIFLAFLLHAAMVGVLGVALGAILGFGLIQYFRAHPIFDWEGFVIRPIITVGVFAWPAITVLLATLAAGVIPAWRAARLAPVDTLRGLD